MSFEHEALKHLRTQDNRSSPSRLQCSIQRNTAGQRLAAGRFVFAPAIAASVRTPGVCSA